MYVYRRYLLALEANKEAQGSNLKRKVRVYGTKAGKKKGSFLGPGGVLMTPSIDGTGKKRGSGKRNEKGQYVKG